MKLQQGYKQPNKYTDILNDNTAIENYKKAKEKQRQQIEEKRLIEQQVEKQLTEAVEKALEDIFKDFR